MAHELPNVTSDHRQVLVTKMSHEASCREIVQEKSSAKRKTALLQSTSIDRWALPVKAMRRYQLPLERQPDDPTIEEISRICRQIQSEWSPAERQRRWQKALFLADEFPANRQDS